MNPKQSKPNDKSLNKNRRNAIVLFTEYSLSIVLFILRFRFGAHLTFSTQIHFSARSRMHGSRFDCVLAVQVAVLLETIANVRSTGRLHKCHFNWCHSTRCGLQLFFFVRVYVTIQMHANDFIVAISLSLSEDRPERRAYARSTRRPYSECMCQRVVAIFGIYTQLAGNNSI